MARYRAPARRRPAKLRRLRVRRKGAAVTVSWRRAARAAQYSVFATSADGDREAFVVPGRKRRLRIPTCSGPHRATIEVAGLRSDGAAGPRAR